MGTDPAEAEDGPKRDRRLWLGDLRLEALANYETYRNFDLVKRLLDAKPKTFYGIICGHSGCCRQVAGC